MANQAAELLAKGIETPSGKGAGDENFPVGSILIARRLRPHVMRYYAFARAADDIADSAELSPDDKLARLEAFDAALGGETPVAEGCESAARLAAELGGIGVPIEHARDLLRAFKQDAVKSRYDDWEDLLGYCRNSANPVGRFLLDLHGETSAGHAASDALCTALQIINHLQDCQADYRDLDRVYLPLDLFEALVGEGIRDKIVSAGAAPRGHALYTSDDARDFFEETYRPFAGGDLNAVPGAFTALTTYDPAFMLVAAMQQAGTVDDTTKIVDALEHEHENPVPH